MDPVTAILAGMSAVGKAVEAIAEAVKSNDVEAEAKALAALDAELADMAVAKDALTAALASNRAEALAALRHKFMPVVP